MGNTFACTSERVEVSDIPKEIKLVPLGYVKSQKGNFFVDEESFKLTKAQFEGRKLDLVIDYEHQTLTDQEAPAGGWIKEMHMTDDAIMAKVEWTPRAKEYLKNKEYRYLSPVVIVRNSDKKLIAIHSAALTNTPAIDGMFAIVNSVDIEKLLNSKEEKGDKTMDWKEIAKLLGLPETASEEDVKKALSDAKKAREDEEKQKEQKEKAEKGAGAGDGVTPVATSAASTEVVANSTVLDLLGLKEGAKTEDVAASIMALKSGEMNIEQELLALKQAEEKRVANELVTSALNAGKISAAQKDWAMSYALKDSKGFESFTDKAPVTVPQGKADLVDAPRGEGIKTDTMILKACGVSEEDFKKYAMKEEI